MSGKITLPHLLMILFPAWFNEAGWSNKLQNSSELP